MAKPVRGAHGGARQGGGRPPGAKNKSTVERELRARTAAEAVLSGADPLPTDVMAARMLDRVLPDGRHVTDSMYEAAVALAPYVHPKLTATTMEVHSDNVHRVVSEKPMTIEEWCRENNVIAADNDTVFPPQIEGTASAD
jgi:hypothetical protein